MIGRLLLFNALQMRFRELKLRRDPSCPLCGEKPVIRELIDYDQFCGVTPPEVETTEAADWELTRQLADGHRPLGQPLEDGSPGRLAEGVHRYCVSFHLP